MAKFRPVIGLLLVLAGCARHHAAAPVAVAAPPPEPRPVLAPGLAAITPPLLRADGRYQTINADLDDAHAVWHLRAALNVAALSCRGPGDVALPAAYNGLLARHKGALAAANRALEGGAGSRADRLAAADAYNTRLYNFFAMPAAKPGFCAAADTVAPEAAALPAGALGAYAPAALARLEAPFTAVFAAVDQYRSELAAWTAREAGAAQLAGTGAAATRLGYANVAGLLAWQPRAGEALAAR